MAKNTSKRAGRSALTALFVAGAFVLTMCVMTLIGLLFPLRPAYSEEEKRELTPFPAFSIQALFSGDWFDGISAWYSDTFPFRSFWVGEDSRLKATYGFAGQQIHGDVQKGDEIPDVPSTPSKTASAPSTVSAASDGASQTASGQDAASQNASSQTASSRVASSQTASSQPAIPANNDENLSAETMGGVLVAGDSAYEFYNFVNATADRYAAAVNRVGDMLAGQCKVYDLIVPTSTGVTLPDNIKEQINSSDQGKAINYMYSLMNGNVVTVDSLTPLLAHRDEYIYFRTDHHWTQRGAWYAYDAFARAAGKTTVPLGNMRKQEFDGFLGSFYTDTGKSPALAAHPDTVEAYCPNDDLHMTVTQKDGSTYTWPVINDVSDYPQTLKYGAFIAGDNPYTEIENRSLTDGSACMIIKESFGNAFVPYLTAHYQTVYVIDYRYYYGSISQLAADNGITDVLFVNNVSATRNDNLVSRLEALN